MANSATLTTMLSLTSKNVTSDILNLKINDLLIVLNDVVKKRIVLNAATATSILSAADYGKSYIFVNNVSTYSIKLLRMTNGDEYMHLSPGQWAWFPWSASLNLEAIGQDGTPTLEVMIFELGHNK